MDKHSKAMDVILILLGLSVFAFTIAMFWLYILTGGIPDTLCSCFFIAVTGECGFMGWIKTEKVKSQEKSLKISSEISQIKQQEEAMNNDINRAKTKVEKMASKRGWLSRGR